MAILNRIRDNNDIYSDRAFKKLKHFILKTSQLVLKSQTEQQINRFKELSQLPPYL